MLATDKVKDALFCSFQDRVEGLRRIDMHYSASIFLVPVIDTCMDGKLFSQGHVEVQLICHDQGIR